MTREKAKEKLWKAHCNCDNPRRAMDSVIDQIFDIHEERLNALSMQLLDEEANRDEAEALAEFNPKARSIVAMLFWEWKKAEREAKIERYDDWENGVSFGEDKKAEELFKKAYAMLKDSK